MFSAPFTQLKWFCSLFLCDTLCGSALIHVEKGLDGWDEDGH